MRNCGLRIADCGFPEADGLRGGSPPRPDMLRLAWRFAILLERLVWALAAAGIALAAYAALVAFSSFGLGL